MDTARPSPISPGHVASAHSASVSRSCSHEPGQRRPSGRGEERAVLGCMRPAAHVSATSAAGFFCRHFISRLAFMSLCRPLGTRLLCLIDLDPRLLAWVPTVLQATGALSGAAVSRLGDRYSLPSRLGVPAWLERPGCQSTCSSRPVETILPKGSPCNPRD